MFIKRTEVDFWKLTQFRALFIENFRRQHNEMRSWKKNELWQVPAAADNCNYGAYSSWWTILWSVGTKVSERRRAVSRNLIGPFYFAPNERRVIAMCIGTLEIQLNHRSHAASDNSTSSALIADCLLLQLAQPGAWARRHSMMRWHTSSIIDLRLCSQHRQRGTLIMHDRNFYRTKCLGRKMRDWKM